MVRSSAPPVPRLPPLAPAVVLPLEADDGRVCSLLSAAGIAAVALLSGASWPHERSALALLASLYDVFLALDFFVSYFASLLCMILFAWCRRVSR